jgi:hypothetical protein
LKLPLCAILPKLPSIVATAMVIAAMSVASCGLVVLICRIRARRRRQYVRLRVVPYRGDDPTAAAIVHMFDALHKRLLRRWWRRLFQGQPSVALEIHYHGEAWLSLTCPAGLEPLVESALRSAYPNCHLQDVALSLGVPPCVVRLKKHGSFIKRAKLVDRFEYEQAPAVNRLITTSATGAHTYPGSI